MLYDVAWSDHFPLQIICNFDVLPRSTKNVKIYPNRVTWGIRSNEQIEIFSDICHKRLRNIDFPSELRMCSDNICDIKEHKLVINKLYKNIIDTLQEASVASYLSGSHKKHKYVTGWNKYVREYHEVARAGFHLWVWYGKPKEGIKICAILEIFLKRN